MKLLLRGRWPPTEPPDADADAARTRNVRRDQGEVVNAAAERAADVGLRQLDDLPLAKALGERGGGGVDEFSAARRDSHGFTHGTDLQLRRQVGDLVQIHAHVGKRQSLEVRRFDRDGVIIARAQTGEFKGTRA